jgi:hypothetical protein
LKFILHDWSDDDCRKILGHIASAMERGFSKLIIEEFVLSDKNCDLRHSMWDWVMMIFCNSMERSITQWSQLLRSAGFTVVKFWNQPGNGTSIIEAELE